MQRFTTDLHWIYNRFATIYNDLQRFTMVNPLQFTTIYHGFTTAHVAYMVAHSIFTTDIPQTYPNGPHPVAVSTQLSMYIGSVFAGRGYQSRLVISALPAGLSLYMTYCQFTSRHATESSLAHDADVEVAVSQCRRIDDVTPCVRTW